MARAQLIDSVREAAQLLGGTQRPRRRAAGAFAGLDSGAPRDLPLRALGWSLDERRECRERRPPAALVVGGAQTGRDALSPRPPASLPPRAAVLPLLSP